MSQTLEQLIEHLIADGYLKTPRIIEAFRAIDRADFVPEEMRRMAYVDNALPIGHGQTISQPLTVALMLEWLAPEPGDIVLDIGGGSGWKAALLAHIVGKEISKPKGKVISIERIPALAKMAEENVAKYNFISRGIVTVLLGDGSKGASSDFLPVGGFDRIIAGAAGDGIPAVWRRQLAAGGRIVAPVGASIIVLEKKTSGTFKETEHFGFSFVPLIKD